MALGKLYNSMWAYDFVVSFSIIGKKKYGAVDFELETKIPNSVLTLLLCFEN